MKNTPEGTLMAKTTKNSGSGKPAPFKGGAPKHPGVHPPKSGGKAAPSKAAKMARTGNC